MTDPHLAKFEASNGVEIYRMPVEVFGGYYAYVHLLVHEEKLTLVDVGSGFGRSHADLEDGLSALEQSFGVSVSLADIDEIIITHGHIDHFGGLKKVKEQAVKAAVSAHELTRPVLVNYDERRLITSIALEDFLKRAGVPEDRRKQLLHMHQIGKQAFESVAVDNGLTDGDKIDGVYEVIHVPGHAPGLIMLKIGDILITADHILPGTSVVLAPEFIMPYTGVSHYIDSLQKAINVEGIRLALGGHEWPMEDYYDVANRTLESSLGKVNRVFNLCNEPRTIYEIAVEIYDSLEGYGELLKLEQTGARVEYLNQRGLVAIDNLEDLEREHTPVLRYRHV